MIGDGKDISFLLLNYLFIFDTVSPQLNFVLFWKSLLTNLANFGERYKKPIQIGFISDHKFIHGSGSGWCTRSKNFKTSFFSRYQKILSWGNSNLEPHQFFFQNCFSTNMVARGVQSFCILEGATDPLIDQWLKFFCQFSPDIWWTNAENFKSISWAVSDLLSFNWKILAIAHLRMYEISQFLRT